MGDAVQTEGHALLKAVSQGKLRLARLLLEGGAYINEGNERGETALSAACTYGDAHVRARMVRYLLEQGADPNMADTAGRTALMRAVNQRAGANVISLLLKHGADPAHKDYSGESALTRALLHALRGEHEEEEPSTDQSWDCNHITDSNHSCDRPPPENHQTNHQTNPGKTSDRASDRASDHASLQLLLEACEGRGQQVLILTCCLQGAHRTVRQYHHCPPERHHCPAPGSAHSEVSDRLNHLKPPDPAPPPPQDTPPQISVNGLPPSDPVPSGPALCDLAASPSDVNVAGANGEGVFSFTLAPPRPRPPRVLKRLNSEPWGLSVPKTVAPPPAQDEVEVQKPLSLVDRPQRRHSIETHDSALNDTLTLTERLKLTERLTLTTEQRAEPPGADSDGPAPDDDLLQRLRPRCNAPPPLLGSSSENLSVSGCSSPLAPRRGRQGAGLLERRGSGTLLLDHLSQPRPFLPPLFNPQRPIPDLRSLNPAPCGPAPRRKKLLRRHSMQPEQMKLLSSFQHVLRENEEK